MFTHTAYMKHSNTRIVAKNLGKFFVFVFAFVFFLLVFKGNQIVKAVNKYNCATPNGTTGFFYL